MKIRRLVEEDLERSAALYTRVFNEAPWSDGWTIAVAHERLERFMAHSGSIGILALEGEEVLGFLLGCCERWVDGEHFHLKEMCVSAERRRKGIGAGLLRSLTDLLKDLDVKAIYLETGPGSPADSFYRKNGFRVIGLQSMSRRESVSETSCGNLQRG